MSQWFIENGDCLDVLKLLPDDSVDAVVTDPPYGLSDHKLKDVVECLSAWLAGQPYLTKKKGFMAKTWDAWVPGPEVWREVYRVMKPGAHAAVFAGSRTQDLMGMALRLAGFELRDTLQWLYGTGFPKSLDVSKAIDMAGGVSPSEMARVLRERRTAAGMSRIEVAEVVGCTEASVRDWEEGRARTAGSPVEWITPSAEYRARLADLLGYTADERRIVGVSHDRRGDESAIGLGHTGELRSGGHTDAAKQWNGWGTALKPAYEPILLVRKPLVGTVAANVLEHGTGGLNIDGCRIVVSDAGYAANHSGDRGHAGTRGADAGGATNIHAGGGSASDLGRWPANVILDEGAAALLDAEAGPVPGQQGRAKTDGEFTGKAVFSDMRQNTRFPEPRGDSGGPSRFFYCAKASSVERDAGLNDDVELRSQDPTRVKGRPGSDNPRNRGARKRANSHPTVKPLSLMRWLCRLVTPTGGLILDPFAGSGTTGCAAACEGFDFGGIELDPLFARIAEQRIAHWAKQRSAA